MKYQKDINELKNMLNQKDVDLKKSKDNNEKAISMVKFFINKAQLSNPRI